MSKVFFTEEHEYIDIEDDIGTIGISDYAQDALGDIVYIELPEIGVMLEKGDQAGVVESVKSASEIYAPIGGEVVEINETLADEPALVNASAMDDGWMYRIKIGNTEELEALKNEDAYKEFIES